MFLWLLRNFGYERLNWSDEEMAERKNYTELIGEGRRAKNLGTSASEWRATGETSESISCEVSVLPFRGTKRGLSR
jgi:hypothetical protein